VFRYLKFLQILYKGVILILATNRETNITIEISAYFQKLVTINNNDLAMLICYYICDATG